MSTPKGAARCEWAMEDLRLYLNDYVSPVIKDFERNPASVRHAFVACVVTFHSVDYLAYPSKSRQLRERWNRESQAFKVVDEVAHAFKHVVSRKRDQKLRAKEVVAQATAFDVATFDGGAFDVGAVTLQGNPGVNILEIVKEAMEFIQRQL